MLIHVHVYWKLIYWIITCTTLLWYLYSGWCHHFRRTFCTVIFPSSSIIPIILSLVFPLSKFIFLSTFVPHFSKIPKTRCSTCAEVIFYFNQHVFCSLILVSLNNDIFATQGFLVHSTLCIYLWGAEWTDKHWVAKMAIWTLTQMSWSQWLHLWLSSPVWSRSFFWLFRLSENFWNKSR